MKDRVNTHLSPTDSCYEIQRQPVEFAVDFSVEFAVEFPVEFSVEFSVVFHLRVENQLVVSQVESVQKVSL